MLRRERGNRLLHLADRHVGIPIVAALGKLRPRRARPAALRTIGLLKTGAIGDLVILSAVIADLRAALPRARLVLFVSDTNSGVAGLVPDVDEMVTLPVTRPLAALRSVRQHRLDLMLDFGPWPRIDALLASLSRARFVVGFETAGQARHFAFDEAVAHTHQRHELENYRALVRAVGVRTRTEPRLIAPPQPPVSAMSGQYAVLHPFPGGSQAACKRWSDTRWIELAGRLAEICPRLFVTGGPDDAAAAGALVHAMRAAGAHGVEAAAGRLDLEETAALLAHARLVISVDTGTAHMAAALGAPLVTLFGPTSLVRWRPLGPRVVVVQADDPRCGYISLGFEPPPAELDCMAGISVDAVHAACLAMLTAPV
jgi:ADP-heptose:LPS heptosyltransferase